MVGIRQRMEGIVVSSGGGTTGTTATGSTAAAAKRRAVTETALRPVGANASLTRVDAADTYTTPLRADDSREPAAWQAGLFAGIPGWVSALMGVRHVLVKPFGLETGGAKSLGDGFPVLSSSPTRIVMGIDDKHLDFRLVVDVDEPAGDVAFTTLVQIHGRSGRAYWAVVKHFHPVVMRSMMARIPSPATPA